MAGYLPLKDDFGRELISPGGYKSIHHVVDVAPSEPLIFTLQPQSQTVDEYALATFSCEVIGGIAPYTYQWKKNGVNVGTNSAALSFTAATTDKNASITATVTDSVGAAIISSAAVLGVASYLYQFDGLSQFIQLASPLTITANTDFEINSKSNFNASGFYVSSDYPAMTSRVLVISNGALFVNNNQVLKLPSPAFDFLTNGQRHKLSIKRVGTTYSASINDGQYITNGTGDQSAMVFTCFFREWGSGGGSNFFKGKASDINVFNNSIPILELPLKNKVTQATQESLSGPNATIVNYNSSGWVQV